MAKIRALLAALILTCGLLLGSTTVSAAEVNQPGLSTGSTTVQKGQEITFLFSLDGYEEIQSGINAIQGTLEYDSDVFLQPVQTDFKPLNSWENVQYNPGNGQFTLFRRAGDTTGGDVLQIKLTAKEDLAAKDTYVRVSGLWVSEGKEDLSPVDVQVQLNAAAQQPATETVSEEETPQPQPDPITETEQPISSNDAPEEEKEETLHQHDPELEEKSNSGMIVFLLCLGAALIMVVLLILFLLLRKKKGGFQGKKLLTVAVILAATATVTAGSVYALGGKGDLNGDGAVDYADVHQLQRHLIALESLPEEKQNAADLNYNGRLTVTDLSLLVQAIEKAVDYEVTLTSAMEKFYYEKQQDVVWKFSATVAPGGEIATVVVNGTEYDLEKGENQGEYTVLLKAADIAGVQTFHISKVTLDSGREVLTDLQESVEVLKDIPAVEYFLTEEKTDSAQMKVSFTLKDEDSALTGAKMEVLQNNNGEFSTIDTIEAAAGSNEFLLNLEEDTAYLLHISAQYDRDTNELQAQEDHRGSLAVMKEIQWSMEYGFTFTGLKAQTETGVETEKFQKNQPIHLWFKSSNKTQFQPAWAVVNGKAYPVEQAGAGYRIVLEGSTQAGPAEIKVEQVVLENGKSFSLQQDHSLAVTILKELPSVTQLTAKEDVQKGEFELTFRLSDPDGALSNGTILIQNAEGKTVGRQPLEEPDLQDGLFQGVIALTHTELTDSYTIQILADCDLSWDSSEPEFQKILAEQTISAAPKAVIHWGSAGEHYLEKASTADLSFSISHNQTAKLVGLVINHTQFVPQQQPDGNWKVTVPTADQAGIQKFVLSGLVFDDQTTLDVHHEITVEIMKSAPAAKDYSTQDNLETGQVTFQFWLEDEDQSFLSGKVQLLSDDGVSVITEEPLSQAGPQELTLNLEEQREYTFRLLLTWKQTEDGSRQIVDDVLLEETVYLIRDYGLKLSGVITSSPEGMETLYFEPGSEMKLRFWAETVTNLAAKQVQINGKVFNLTPLERNWYELTAEIGSQPGVQALVFEKLMLENEKTLTVESGPSVQVEVLKAAPKVEQFRWEETAQEELKVQFLFSDPDGALEHGQIQIEEKNGAVLKTLPVSAGKQEAVVALTAQENYVVRITADYDRDTNALDAQSNRYQGQELYSCELAIARDGIQLKDVTSTKLFYSQEDSEQEITLLDITNGLPADPEQYYVVIETEDLPDYYAAVKEFRQDSQSGRVYAVLEQEEMILYGEDGSKQTEYTIPLAYRDGDGVHPLITSAQELFSQMNAAPYETFHLTEDLDASALSADHAAIQGTFTGTLNGNGYAIKNLPTSLFQTLSGATIQNLVIENAEITASRSGILANVIQNGSIIENVFILNSSIENGVDELGAFAGNLRSSTIQKSASVNVRVKGLVAVGGIVGKTNAGAVIDNCYVTGQVQGTYDHPTLGARVGGIAGWHGGGMIQNSFTQVQVIAPAQKGNGGLIGGPNTGSPALENCLSLSHGSGYRIAGFDVLDNVKNIYEYSGSTSITNITQQNQAQIQETDAVFDKAFYTETLHWEESIWDLDLLAYGKRPNLKTAPQRDNNYGIPAYSQLLQLEGYQPQREQAYANLAKLMPFSDIRTWVEYGNRLAEDHSLVKQAVDFVLPLDENGALAVGVHRNELDEIQKIRIVFEQGKMQEYPVFWKKSMGNLVAVYEIQGMEAMYQPRQYIENPEASLLEAAVSLVSDFDYATEIAALTQEEESRLYTDYYNETVKAALNELVAKLLLSQPEYPTYSDSEVLQELVRKRVSDQAAWKKLLYGYNYYHKWYRMDYSGVDLSHLLFFHGTLLGENLTASTLSDLLLTAPSEQRATHRTVVFYNNTLKNHTGKTLTDFLGDLSCRIGGFDNPNDWFAANFDGILKEQAPQDGAEGIRYRIWDILSGLEDNRKSILLPILTAPQEDMYLISLPSQLMLGSLNRYPTYLVKDGMQRQRMEEIIETYAEKMGIFYGVSSRWAEDSVDILNSFVNIQYDTRLNFPQSEAADAGDQDRDKTRDPVMKWVYEANNTISAKNGSAAFADGTNVYWVQDAALGTSDYTFFTFSHETAHNQDGRYFYGGAGRRRGTGAEAHADGNIAQEMRDGCMVFNISKINDLGVEMTNNFSYERIDSPEKIQSYYSRMFETGYVLDYLAAQAFLRLTPQQQAAVAVQATHTPGGNASFSTQYHDVSEEEILQMGLKDLEDLWENRISIRNINKGSTQKVNTATDGSYGFESFYVMNWYQSHNDNGSPDTHAFKRLGMEMLGVGGYENGYRIYMSALSENDLDALRQITGKADMTWKDYKMARFQNVQDNLHRIPYFQAETVIRQFQEAFERDAQNGTRSESIAVKRMLYGIVKRATGDFSDGGIYQSPEVISVDSAEELLALAAQNPYGVYRLEADLDFTAITAAQESYLPHRFMGILDGNGYQLKGMQIPLFGDLQYALVKNLTIAQPSFSAKVQAALAIKTRQVVLGNVTVEENGTQLPLIKTKTEGFYQYTE